MSDRFGRRPIILTSVVGIGIDYILLAWAPSLWWLFVGRLVAGATSANVAAATAYIADVSGEGARARRFGWVGATFGAGFVIGPALGGFLGEYGLRLPFYAAAALAFANALYGIFLLPEGLQPEDRRPVSWARANPFGPRRNVWRDPALRRMAVAWSCSWIGLGAVQSSLVLFTRYSFGWGAAANGWVLAGIGASQAVAEGFLLGFVTARLGERHTAMLGYAAGAAGYAVLFSLALAGWTVALLALGGLAVPSVRAMVSARGAVDNQGEMQGVLTAVEGLTRRRGAAADGVAVLCIHLARLAGALRGRAVSAGSGRRADRGGAAPADVMGRPWPGKTVPRAAGEGGCRRPQKRACGTGA